MVFHIFSIVFPLNFYVLVTGIFNIFLLGTVKVLQTTKTVKYQIKVYFIWAVFAF